MLVEMLLSLPRWVHVGVVVGVLMSAGVAATFLVAPRLLPDGDRSRGSRRSTEARRRVEIRRYLDAIGEDFVENAEAGDEIVAFYLPGRSVAITFDARTFLTLKQTAIDGILMEHEMPGAAIGRRLPFEAPSPDPDADVEGQSRAGQNRRKSPDPTGSAYAVLGLRRDASEAAVRRAYRERVKDVHPDHGGDEAEFRRVREAYDTARRGAR